MTRRKPRPIVPPWTEQAVAQLGRVSDRKIARSIGLPVAAVQAEREARAIPRCPPGRKLPPGGRRDETVSVRCSAAELAAIDADRGDQPRESYVRDAALARATGTCAARADS